MPLCRENTTSLREITEDLFLPDYGLKLSSVCNYFDLFVLMGFDPRRLLEDDADGHIL